MGSGPHLDRAYELARQHNPHPNPRVGAVIVAPDGNVLAEGSHVAPGEAHAEVVALNQVADASGATLYVSLEPCSHHGRTPPCTGRLIDEGIAAVVIGALDPDSRVAGSGVEELEAAGVEVTVLDDPAARAVDPAYFHHRETGFPWVTAKYAMTLDGSVAAADGSSKWITGREAREDAHRLRAEHDAIVIGAGTLVADDPRLDVRLAGYNRQQPRPIIIAGRTPLPWRSGIWKRDPLVIAAIDIDIPGGELVIVEGDEFPDPVSTCRALGAAGYLSLLVEGGPTLLGSWWSHGVISGGVVYVGSRVGGGHGMSPLTGVFESIVDATSVIITDTRLVGEDVRIDFHREI
ncbi:MAG TPA: bifunctional diaminohydroxyphosphoribosylaminopyrimidine deaminase/5-amino-6-(5-phosphoribosylamino)uracil reductase RibD [Acidimicrobiia bacterium]|nr:bifunctional diaminohydroxyphosphoribosylaminopyrimidine deaminase/5-amino-6-(5-phosphoribosylamino)uracil reductase RibD [Acidimicrobiia bacterium]